MKRKTNFRTTIYDFAMVNCVENIQLFNKEQKMTWKDYFLLGTVAAAFVLPVYFAAVYAIS